MVKGKFTGFVVEDKHTGLPCTCEMFLTVYISDSGTIIVVLNTPIIQLHVLVAIPTVQLSGTYFHNNCNE
ncbi:MAG: hypothetical protein MJE68_05295, partial [Proteobacteria bacterium]|nr:hypothetical protein [Pseudomonadota bacterium]